jgi:hypothetical protein
MPAGNNLGALSARRDVGLFFQGRRETRSPLATFCRASGAGGLQYSRLMTMLCRLILGRLDQTFFEVKHKAAAKL